MDALHKCLPPEEFCSKHLSTLQMKYCLVENTLESHFATLGYLSHAAGFAVGVAVVGRPVAVHHFPEYLFFKDCIEMKHNIWNKHSCASWGEL